CTPFIDCFASGADSFDFGLLPFRSRRTLLGTRTLRRAPSLAISRWRLGAVGLGLLSNFQLPVGTVHPGPVHVFDEMAIFLRLRLGGDDDGLCLLVSSPRDTKLLGDLVASHFRTLWKFSLGSSAFSRARARCAQFPGQWRRTRRA